MNEEKAAGVPQSPKKALKNAASVLVWPFLVWLLMAFVLSAAVVQGDSMRPNYQPGDLVLALRTHDVDRGDVVLVESDALGMVIIKRVVGLPGDVVEVRDGTVYVNSEPAGQDYAAYIGGGDYGPAAVPDGELFLMGDNRPVSLDSRDPSVGCVPYGQLTGKVMLSVRVAP